MQKSTAVLERSEKLVLAVTYLLYMLLVTAPFGAAINALRIRHFRNMEPNLAKDRAESVANATEHHVWLIRTLAIVMILLMVAVGTAYTLFGVVVLAATAVWWLYRLGKGVLALVENQHLPTAV